MKQLTRAAVLVAAMSASVSLMAHEQGDWLLRFGASNVDPKSDNHPLVSVDDAWGVTFNFSYMYTENIAFEVLAALPYSHDITLGGTKVAETDHLPPTFSVQYHFLPGGSFQPYVGVGLNYTTFFSEDTQGALEGVDLKLDDSFGYALQAGFDVPINEKWFFNADIRYIDIETDATADGTDIGTVEIDPLVYGVNLGVRF